MGYLIINRLMTERARTSDMSPLPKSRVPLRVRSLVSSFNFDILSTPYEMGCTAQPLCSAQSNADRATPAVADLACPARTGSAALARMLAAVGRNGLSSSEAKEVTSVLQRMVLAVAYRAAAEEHPCIMQNLEAEQRALWGRAPPNNVAFASPMATHEDLLANQVPVHALHPSNREDAPNQATPVRTEPHTCNPEGSNILSPKKVPTEPPGLFPNFKIPPEPCQVSSSGSNPGQTDEQLSHLDSMRRTHLEGDLYCGDPAPGVSNRKTITLKWPPKQDGGAGLSPEARTHHMAGMMDCLLKHDFRRPAFHHGYLEEPSRVGHSGVDNALSPVHLGCSEQSPRTGHPGGFDSSHAHDFSIDAPSQAGPPGNDNAWPQAQSAFCDPSPKVDVNGGDMASSQAHRANLDHPYRASHRCNDSAVLPYAKSSSCGDDAFLPHAQHDYGEDGAVSPCARCKHAEDGVDLPLPQRKYREPDTLLPCAQSDHVEDDAILPFAESSCCKDGTLLPCARGNYVGASTTSLDARSKLCNDEGGPSLLPSKQHPSACTMPLSSRTQPPSACTQPPFARTQPPSACTQPPPACTQPPSACTQPPPACTQPPSACTQPPPACTQPPSACTQAPSACTQPPSAYTQPPSECTQPDGLTQLRQAGGSIPVAPAARSSMSMHVPPTTEPADQQGIHTMSGGLRPDMPCASQVSQLQGRATSLGGGAGGPSASDSHAGTWGTNWTGAWLSPSPPAGANMGGHEGGEIPGTPAPGTHPGTHGPRTKGPRRSQSTPDDEYEGQARVKGLLPASLALDSQRAAQMWATSGTCIAEEPRDMSSAPLCKDPEAAPGGQVPGGVPGGVPGTDPERRQVLSPRRAPRGWGVKLRGRVLRPRHRDTGNQRSGPPLGGPPAALGESSLKGRPPFWDTQRELGSSGTQRQSPQGASTAVQTNTGVRARTGVHASTGVCAVHASTGPCRESMLGGTHSGASAGCRSWHEFQARAFSSAIERAESRSRRASQDTVCSGTTERAEICSRRVSQDTTSSGTTHSFSRHVSQGAPSSGTTESSSRRVSQDRTFSGTVQSGSRRAPPGAASSGTAGSDRRRVSQDTTLGRKEELLHQGPGSGAEEDIATESATRCDRSISQGALGIGGANPALSAENPSLIGHPLLGGAPAHDRYSNHCFNAAHRPDGAGWASLEGLKRRDLTKEREGSGRQRRLPADGSSVQGVSLPLSARAFPDGRSQSGGPELSACRPPRPLDVRTAIGRVPAAGSCPGQWEDPTAGTSAGFRKDPAAGTPLRDNVWHRWTVDGVPKAPASQEGLRVPKAPVAQEGLRVPKAQDTQQGLRSWVQQGAGTVQQKAACTAGAPGQVGLRSLDAGKVAHRLAPSKPGLRRSMSDCSREDSVRRCSSSSQGSEARCRLEARLQQLALEQHRTILWEMKQRQNRGS
eukprot:jgi/Botrbrau1/14913/Bobra.0018s0017.1